MRYLLRESKYCWSRVYLPERLLHLFMSELCRPEQLFEFLLLDFVFDKTVELFGHT